MSNNTMWLNYTRIQQRVDISFDDLVQKLGEFHNMWGGRKRVVVRNGEYLLNKNYVDEFIKKFNLVSLKDVPLQDKNWISAIRLSSVFRVHSARLVDFMRDLKDDPYMQDKSGMHLIQFRKTSNGRYVSLCLFNSDEAKNKFAKKIGLETNRFSKKVPYRMQYDWSGKRKFSDNEIDNAIINLMNKNYDFVSEIQCADALLSELPKSQEQILEKQWEQHIKSRERD